ncbi:MAG: hypothetical protein Q8K24_05795 [Hydrogenophaga sp.]|nr:hypothetical protein [Hydrogenophaga sp.]
MKCTNCGRPTAVVETRVEPDGLMLRRRRACRVCDHRFNTFEIDDGLAATVRKYAATHAKAVARRQALTLRNERIAARLRAGEKHVVVAGDFGLSDNMVSTIARRLGIPGPRQALTGRAS